MMAKIGYVEATVVSEIVGEVEALNLSWPCKESKHVTCNADSLP